MTRTKQWQMFTFNRCIFEGEQACEMSWLTTRRSADDHHGQRQKIIDDGCQSIDCCSWCSIAKQPSTVQSFSPSRRNYLMSWLLHRLLGQYLVHTVFPSLLFTWHGDGWVVFPVDAAGIEQPRLNCTSFPTRHDNCWWASETRRMLLSFTHRRRLWFFCCNKLVALIRTSSSLSDWDWFDNRCSPSDFRKSNRAYL